MAVGSTTATRAGAAAEELRTDNERSRSRREPGPSTVIASHKVTGAGINNLKVGESTDAVKIY